MCVTICRYVCWYVEPFSVVMVIGTWYGGGGWWIWREEGGGGGGEVDEVWVVVWVGGVSEKSCVEEGVVVMVIGTWLQKVSMSRLM
jgi:hypothetical protein